MKQLNFLLLIIFLLTMQNIKAQLTESEPNNTRQTADSMSANGSLTGTINNVTDQEWFKIVLPQDGDLFIKQAITYCSLQQCYTNFTVYSTDGNKDTILFAGINEQADLKGLLAGTYYVSINENTGFLPENSTYEFTTTFAGQTTDIEPNNNAGEALLLPLNGSKVGTVGYSNKIKKDTADWYKIITNADGLLRISAASGNGNLIYIELYDNNGITVLNGASGTANAVLNQDGLAAGTYYIKVTSYYNHQFEPYTISDSLLTYNYASDAENNGKPYLAKTILSNGNTNGHVGFYYNNQRDTTDWFKIIIQAPAILILQ